MEGTTVFDMGKTIPGVEKKVSLIIKNEHSYPIELSNPRTNDEDFKIVNFPKYLTPGQSGMVEFAFAPAKERIVPLNTTWGFEVTIG